MAMRTGAGTIASTANRWELAENETMRLPRGPFPTAIRIERGTVLITQEGDLDDHVLEPGDEIVIPVGGLAVAWAFTEAVIASRDAASTGSTRGLRSAA
jgi:hypothetical protein